jgi:hypothetical protein
MSRRLEMKNETFYLGAVEIAKRIREELKKHFPKTKFSVRVSSYTGGSSIIVKWIDGVSEDQVKKVINKFRGADFDFVSDAKTSIDNRMLVDFILTERKISPELIVKISNIILKSFGIDKTLETIEQVESFKLSDYKENPKYPFLGQYASHIAQFLDLTNEIDLESFIKNNL